MRRSENPNHWKLTVLRVVLWTNLVTAISCSSNYETNVGGHVGSPAKVATYTTASSAQLPPLPTSVPGTSYPLPPFPWTKSFPPAPSTWWERKVAFSSLQKAIVDACPERAWSQNVQHEHCTSDGDCGDGYCDRGHCDVIRTCGHFEGLPCDADEQCAGVCFEGRCRSCVAKTECEKKDPKWPWVCNPGWATAGRRTCMVDIEMANRPGPGSP